MDETRKTPRAHALVFQVSNRRSCQQLAVLAKFMGTMPRSLCIDIIEMYLLDHKETIERARKWAKRKRQPRCRTIILH